MGDFMPARAANDNSPATAPEADDPLDAFMIEIFGEDIWEAAGRQVAR